MINILLLLLILTPNNITQNLDCKPTLKEGTDAGYDGDGDEIIGIYSLSDCCSETKYCFIVEGVVGSSYRMSWRKICESRLVDSGESNVVTIGSSGFEVVCLEFNDEDNCGCKYLFHLENNDVGGVWTVYHGTESELKCEKRCDQ